MPTLITIHDVDDVEHWLASPRRKELFDRFGMSARTFVVDREKSKQVGLIMEVPSMEVFQQALRSEATAEAMRLDGVRQETLLFLTAA